VHQGQESNVHNEEEKLSADPTFNWMLMEMMIRDWQISIEDIPVNSWNDGNSIII
jgi:hypothetical protein